MTKVLLTGATGYVGGRLRRVLEAQGSPLRCLARNPDYLKSRVAAATEVVAGDVLDRPSLEAALEGIDAAYYLVHSMGASGDFEDRDREGAENFGAAARKAGVSRIIYLGGLGDSEQLSPHLASRQEVGEILRQSGVPTLEFRASIVIGSGSLSFELIRALVEKLPIMITPRWVRQKAQPIAIEDVVDYLQEALNFAGSAHRIFEIGGPDRVSYADLMAEYARLRGLRRLVIPVPVLSPRLSSLWLGLVSPVYARIGRKLVDSLRNETVVRDTSALTEFKVRPRGVREAMERALSNEDQEFAETRWSDALSSKGQTKSWGGIRLGSRLVDSRVIVVNCPPSQAFEPISRIGGTTGWYYANWLWRLRGFLDLLVGGVGVRRGRRHPRELVKGDAVDFWRVEEVIPGQLLRLVAEMKIPGRAWLQFEVEPHDGGSLIRQTALYEPAGLSGLLYWYALYPVHQLVFGGMLRRLGPSAEALPLPTR